MRKLLEDVWQGKRVCLVEDAQGLSPWLDALLTALGAQARRLDAPDGLPAPALLEAAIEEAEAHALILPGLPGADTPEALCALLYRLSACLAAARGRGLRAVLLCLDDSAYRGGGTPWAYAEDAPLGGIGPAGCAAACARLMAEGYRAGFYGPSLPVVVAHRGPLVWDGETPPAPRRAGAPVPVQHALEPLAGALLALGRALAYPAHPGDTWNFGAPPENWMTPRQSVPLSGPAYVQLESARARTQLGWRTVYDGQATLALLCAWDALCRAGGPAAARQAQARTYLARLNRIAD
ncbi:MAG: hypothetical protein LBU67_06760 [Oscillospiraceae bacterium]|nr:hypothetical protein [Oscillospiraceae bacterium]